MRLARAALAFALFAPGAACAAAPAKLAAERAGIIAIEVDATDVDHRIFSVRERIPAQPGPLTLLYPQWIPGNHSPTGKPWLIAGLRFTAGGGELAWRRDPVDVYAFTVDVPEGMSEVQVDYQYLSALQPSQGPLVFAPELFTLAWNYVALYPAGYRVDGLRYRASLRVPAGWQAASALTLEARDGDLLRYAPATLETLVDSPSWAGMHVKRVPLEAEPPATVDVFADLPGHLPQADAAIEPFRVLMRQEQALFGAAPYAHYDFLLALHERIHPHGLEHQQSTEIREPPELFSNAKAMAHHGAVFSHELTHAWIGKKHRPADLATPTFNMPMGTSLLWVYEGETDYWGLVLAARSGLLTVDQARDALANLAAVISSRPGRSWRDLQDTTLHPVIHYDRVSDWPSWQRTADYYGEGAFLWMEADARIRAATAGQRSLDDFARGFHGAAAKAAGIVTYTFDDVVRGLDTVSHDDWRAFLRERLDTRTRDTATAALAATGWRVAWRDKPNALQEAADRERGTTDFTSSLGFAVGKQDLIPAVQWDSPAFRAGLSGNSTLVAVNGHAFKADVLRLAVQAARDSKAPIALLVRSGDEYRTVNVDYHGGLRYPHLERIEGTADLLSAILAPR